MRPVLAGAAWACGLVAVVAGVVDAPASVRPGAVLAGVVALLLLAGALTSASAPALGASAVALAAPAVLALHAHDRGADPVAAVVAGAVVVATLLAGRSFDLTGGIELRAERLRAEIVVAGVAGAGAVAAAGVVLLVAGTRAPGGTLRLALGLGAVLAVVLLLAAVAATARRGATDQD